MIFGKAWATTPLHDITLHLNNIVTQECSVLLRHGVIFDENFTFNDHVKFLLKKCYGSLSKIQSYKRILSTDLKQILVDALIISHLRYCAQVRISRLNKKQFQRINNVLKSSARFCVSKRKYYSILNDVCNPLEFLFPDFLCKFKLWILPSNAHNV